jgi:hypothetical protein
MRLMIKRVLTIITLERWTVRWDIPPIDRLHLHKTMQVQILETVQCLPESVTRIVEDDPEDLDETDRSSAS